MTEREEIADSHEFIGWYDGYHGRDPEVAALKAEIERLRAALETAAQMQTAFREYGINYPRIRKKFHN